MTEVLSSMMEEISQAKALPDADLEFLVELETFILNKIREPVDATMGGVNSGAAGLPPSAPGAPGAPGTPTPPVDPLQAILAAANSPGAVPTSPAPPGGGARGMRSEPPAPNPDELRRMVGGQQQ